MVVNAACKDADLAHMQKHLAATCEIEPMFSRGLLALQGPQAVAVLARLAPQVATMKFMTGAFVVDRRRALLRHALGLHRRGRLRDLDARPMPGRRHRPQAAGASPR